MRSVLSGVDVAKLFSADRIVPAWIAAARSLDAVATRTDRNFVLEINSPTLLADNDHQVIREVDRELRAHTDGIGVFTVAGTLFPQGLYLRYGQPDFYRHFLTAMKAGKREGTWGTYAMRMMERINPRTREVFNPLEKIVSKLHATHSGRKIVAAYELGVHDVADLQNEPVACELPLYEPASDGGRPTNIPCLSHLSFKLDPESGTVDLTAVYRSHHYGKRALGNLLGLSQLLAFVAKESGNSPGVLTCVSTLAHLDVNAFGGAMKTRTLLKRLSAT